MINLTVCPPRLLSIIRWAVRLGCLAFVSHPASAELVLNIDYSGDAAYESAFTDAAGTWQSLLVGYQDGFLLSTEGGSSYAAGEVVSDVFIMAEVKGVDGRGGVLGRAGPTAGGIDRLGYTLATDGIMEFDEADVAGLAAGGLFDDVVLHEIAHVLGFGTLWGDNGVYVSGTGEFLGPHATLAWQTEFGQMGTPDVELDGGAGTANGHWNEVAGGAGATGITDSADSDMRDELMTGWLNSNPFISEMTVSSFVDIGFSGAATAVPEPSAFWAMASLSCLPWLRQQIRCRRADSARIRKPSDV